MRELDVQTIRDLLKGPGIDTREWVSYGIVQTDSTEDDRAVAFSEEYGPLVNITLQPQGVDVRARVAGTVAGNGEGEWYPFQAGDEVIVLLVSGRYENAVIIGRMNQEIDKFPTLVAGNEVNTNTFGFRRIKAPYVTEVGNQYIIINSVTNAAFIMEEAGNVTLRNGDLSFLHLGSDFLGIQTNDGTLLMQMNLSTNKIRLAHNNDPGKPSFIFDMNGEASNLATGGTLAIGTSGNFAQFHAVSLESVLAILMAYSSLIGAQITSLGGPAAYLAPVFASPGPVSAIPGGLNVEGALPVANNLPFNQAFINVINAILGTPKLIGTPGIGCVGFQIGLNNG